MTVSDLHFERVEKVQDFFCMADIIETDFNSRISQTVLKYNEKKSHKNSYNTEIISNNFCRLTGHF